MRGGLAMVSRILGAVLSVVLIAASGFGGYVGMKAVVDKVEADVAVAAPMSLDQVLANGVFSLHLPMPFFVSSELPADGETFATTLWTTDEADGVAWGVAFADIGQEATDAGLEQQTLLHMALDGGAWNISGDLTDEEAFVLAADPARRGVVEYDGGRVFATAVLHGTKLVAIMVIARSGSAPPEYAGVIASLQWFA